MKILYGVVGYGRCAASLEDPAVIHGFLEGVPASEEKLASYKQDGNERLYATIDGLLKAL